jgi:hypothetical protein
LKPNRGGLGKILYRKRRKKKKERKKDDVRGLHSRMAENRRGIKKDRDKPNKPVGKQMRIRPSAHLESRA